MTPANPFAKLEKIKSFQYDTIPMLNDYENAIFPSRQKAVRLACAYLQKRLHSGICISTTFEHGVHVLNVAKLASAVAKETKVLNPNKAYVLGLWHDVGCAKSETRTGIPHGIEGYNLLRRLGYKEIASICITHNFIEKDFNPVDFPTYKPHQVIEAKKLLGQMEYNDYDHLVQLCDMCSCGRNIYYMKERMDRIKNFYKLDKISYEDSAYKLRDSFNAKFGVNVEEIAQRVFGQSKKRKEIIISLTSSRQMATATESLTPSFASLNAMQATR